MPGRINSFQVASGQPAQLVGLLASVAQCGPSSLARSTKEGRVDEGEAATLVVLLIFFLRPDDMIEAMEVFKEKRPGRFNDRTSARCRAATRS
jgi:hypothetical protein